MLVAEKRNIKSLFEPESVAVIGASRRTEAVGYAILHNLLKGNYKGTVYPVNPNADTLEGLKCHPSVSSIPGNIEMAVIIVPSTGVPQMLRECGEKGVQAAIVITAGFKEIGGEGVKLEKEVADIAKKYGIAVLGPNCLGICNTDSKSSMDASFSKIAPLPGNIAFISQSGALCASILDYACGENIGFSKFISMGNKVDITELDMLRYLKDDPQTKVILMYLEDIVNGQEFIELARETTRKKPIIALKSGRTAQGAKAASSHTGSIMGSDSVYDAIFTQSGVIRVDSMLEMFNLAIAFAYEPLPKGNRVAIVTNAGGPGIMATDACIRAGLAMSEFKPETREELKKVLPPTANFSNPVDVIGDARSDRYQKALDIVAKDPSVDSVLILLTPQSMTEIVETANVITPFDEKTDLPTLACFMGHVNVGAGTKILQEHEVPSYLFPEQAAQALGAMYRYTQWLQRPSVEVKQLSADKKAALEILQGAEKKGQKALLIHEAMDVFKAYGIPLLPYALTRSASEASSKAAAMGFPVVLKVVSHEVIHKVDVGGVRLNIQTEADVTKAYEEMTAAISKTGAKIEGVLVQKMAAKGREVILGMTRDARFGPVLMFGLGGIYVEALKDVSFRLAPVREIDAREMIASIRTYPLLKGLRGEKPADQAAIAECLMRLSQLSLEQPLIKEIDINPLLVGPEGQGAWALDARIIL